MQTKTIISVAQWIISALAIPSLVWAWSLSTQVALQQQEIKNLQSQVEKQENYATQLAAINVHLNNLKENIGEIKEILRGN